jgi:ABC-type antimicrobial peptide transport system permease subunit
MSWLACSQALRGILYEISPTDPAALLGATALVALAALIAGWLPAHMASRVTPMEVLRAE